MTIAEMKQYFEGGNRGVYVTFLPDDPNTPAAGKYIVRDFETYTAVRNRYDLYLTPVSGAFSIEIRATKILMERLFLSKYSIEMHGTRASDGEPITALVRLMR
ncbi:MAG: hypothetical protein LUC18_02145 [Porphyromonadaceae bacterium]|nr:hypothetical protein [Porphyromonadaceae bacterium]